MYQKILRLPETAINQIAAGEVVENPASVVKELLENSLDAGAKHISIDFIDGGLQLIRVEDDGSGMGPEDALLSLERYATSKIRSAEDLRALATMGFRGEALAAISSISHFELKTSNGIGTRIVAEGGRILTVEPCARNRGTTVEVRSLFYNVPARRKFQKSAASNASQATRLVETIALAYPEVAFTLNRKEFVPANWKRRIEDILGSYEHEVKGDGVTGFVAAPAKAMSTRTGQYVFINRRPIFSPLISKAVKEGFGTRIAEHAYPRFILFLDVSPDAVDVNVHPQKREVRFRDERMIFYRVQKGVEAAFSPPMIFSEPIFFSPPPTFSLAEESSLLPPEETKLDFIFHDQPVAVLGSYLLLQKERLILVDLRAAHARILFEVFQFEKGASQALIWPLEITLAEGEEEVVEKLNKMGIECRILHRTLVVDALPPFLEAARFPEFFASWKEGKKIEYITTRFCRTIQKVYSLDEANLIWQRLQKCRDSTYDPLGKQIWVEIGEEKLGKLFYE